MISSPVHSREAEVDELDRCTLLCGFELYVLRLDASMDDFIGMEVGDRLQQRFDDARRGLLGEASIWGGIFADLIEQFAAGVPFRHDVNATGILVAVDHLHNTMVVRLVQHADLLS